MKRRGERTRETGRSRGGWEMQRASGGDRKIEQQRVTPAALNIVFAFAGCVVFVVASSPRMNAAASSLAHEVG